MKQAAWASTAAALQQHYAEAVLPLWSTRGFNAQLGLPHEALDHAGQPLPDTRYRAMACARQVYVFAMAPGDAAMAHAGRLFDALLQYFYDAQRDAWRFSVDAEGRPLDQAQDLYTYAFVVLACATYFGRSRDARALKHMLATARVVESRFGRSDGLYAAALDADGKPTKGPEQNPIMHLTEAYLAAARVAEPSWFAQALRRMAESVALHFLDPGTQCITELPVGVANNRIEPGHQFEWYSLLSMAPEVFEGLDLPRALPRGCLWARAAGVVVDTAGVCAALDMSGQVIDAQQRIWAQTEYARYLALAGEDEVLATQLVQFQRRFLHAGGWHEILAVDDTLLRADMPSTTPYHLLTGYSALQA